MKFLVLLSFVLGSVNLFANDIKIKCEMVDVKNSENKIDVILENLDEDGYADGQSDIIDNMYSFGVAAVDVFDKNSGVVDIIINDDNDEVGSFYCELENERSSNLICSEPIYDFDNVYKYDLNCYFL